MYSNYKEKIVKKKCRSFLNLSVELLSISQLAEIYFSEHMIDSAISPIYSRVLENLFEAIFEISFDNAHHILEKKVSYTAADVLSNSLYCPNKVRTEHLHQVMKTVKKELKNGSN